MKPSHGQGRAGRVVAASAVALSILTTLVMLAPPVGAAEAAKAPAPQPSGKIASLWIFWPAAGHEADFVAATKKHVAWRKTAGDPFAWEAYEPVAGSELGFYVWRSGAHGWAELDREQAWEESSKAGENFQRDVMPFVARYEHQLTENDFEHSKWAMRDDFNYFWVEGHALVPGGRAGMSEALDKIHKAIVAAQWPVNYGAEWTLTGRSMFQMVFPFVDYAGMVDPEPPLMKILTDQLGSEEAAKAVLQQWDASIASSQTTLYRLRRDLSTPK